MKFGLFVVIALCVAFAGRVAHAENTGQWNTDLRPNLLYGSEEESVAPALKFSLGYENGRPLGLEEKGQLYGGFLSEGVVATNPDVNAENLFWETFGGLKHTFSRIPSIGTADGNEPFRPDRPIPINEGEGETMLDLPFLHVAATARFESDQRFDNYNVAFGSRLGLIHTRQDALSWWVLLPKLQLEYGWVSMLQSRSLESRGIEEDDFWRLGALGDWRWELGRWAAPEDDGGWFRGFGLHSRLSYHEAFGLENAAERLGHDRFFRVSGGAHYRFRERQAAVGRFRVDLVYLTVGHGSLPPQTQEQTNVEAGLSLGWD